MVDDLTRNRLCRICKSEHLDLVLDFGSTPLANSFVKKSDLNKSESSYPLRTYLCQDCGLLQMRDIVSPKILFKDYVYVSSTSKTFIKHFTNFADHVLRLYSFPKQSLVVDIGSNDGILLKPFKNKGYRVLGIEPAQNIAALANKSGIPTIAEFFSISLAKQVVAKQKNARAVTATNVFAHINNLDEIVAGVKILIGKCGIFIIEVPYLVDFINKNLFDTVYHEHLSYLAVTPLTKLFSRFQLHIIRVEKTDSHGGSLRVFVADQVNSLPIDTSVKVFLREEKRLKLIQVSTYKQFFARIKENKKQLLTLLRDLKAKGNHIAAYGAPAKGNTLLNYFGIDRKLIDFIVDDSEYKQGLFTPGTHIPVVQPNRLYTDKPDYVLLLAWNFADSIMKTHARYLQQGGKFILPVPIPKIFS